MFALWQAASGSRRTRRRECHGAAGPDAQPRVMLMVRARCGDDRLAGSRSGTYHDVGGARTAHTTHRQAVVPAATGV